MKSKFNILAFFGFVLIALASFSGFDSFHAPLSQKQTDVVINKVYGLNHAVTHEIILDTTRFGVCDTCRGSFLTAVETNRKLVDSLTVQNAILYDKFEKSIELSAQLDNVNKEVEKRIEKAKAKRK